MLVMQNHLKQNQKLFDFLKEQGFKTIADRLKNNSYIVSSAIIEKKESNKQNKYLLLNSKKIFKNYES